MFYLTEMPTGSDPVRTVEIDEATMLGGIDAIGSADDAAGDFHRL